MIFEKKRNDSRKNDSHLVDFVHFSGDERPFLVDGVPVARVLHDVFEVEAAGQIRHDPEVLAHESRALYGLIISAAALIRRIRGRAWCVGRVVRSWTVVCGAAAGPFYKRSSPLRCAAERGQVPADAASLRARTTGP